MKFTNGYWLMKPEITPLYAAEYASHTLNGDTLTVFAPGKHITDRGDCLNIGMLTIQLTTPAENIIRVSLCHFAGGFSQGPSIAVSQRPIHPEVTEDENTLRYRSGALTAVIDKRPNQWSITFYRDGVRLTDTAWRNMAYMSNAATGKHYMVEQLDLGVGGKVYGLGERFTPFVKNGQTVEMWNEDGGTASEIAYKNIPFYLTNRGYGILVDQLDDTAFEICSEKVERVQFSVEGESLAYYVIAGADQKEVLRRYTDLTGKPALPPAWSFGLWLTTSFTTNYDEETTSSFIQGMAERNIPLSVFHFDCYWMNAYRWCDFLWDSEAFPDPEGTIRRYHDRGLRICVWINSYIGQMSYLFREGKENGYLVKKTDGSIWQTDLWQPGMALVDFTNPAAVKWYQSKLKILLDMGVDCFKTDFGERIPVKDIAWFDGSDPVKMHNYYTYLYNRTVFTLLEQERGTGEAVLFARSATVGAQQFPAHWGGDCSASYPSMAETLRGGLSLACGGFGFWSHDISGFEQTASADLYKRWCQFGMLSSHSRLHGSASYRVPWLFDEEACVILREFTELKCRLMPYLYGQAVLSHETGIPMLRPMCMEFPDDRTCEDLDLQYMLGYSLLVAPIFDPSGSVTYYLPAGKWTNLITGQKQAGGRWVTEHYDYHALPLMVRENTILPMTQTCTTPEYNLADGLTLCLSDFSEGASAVVTVYDLHGKAAGQVTAIHSDGKTIVETDAWFAYSTTQL